MDKNLIKLYNPEKEGRLRIAVFISGSGSNLERIIENQAQGSYEVALIFSDNMRSRAYEIGVKHNIPVSLNDIGQFYKQRNKLRSDLKVREEFDSTTTRVLQSYKIKVIAYAGYMSIVTKPLVENFLGINVHPADLTIKRNGRRAYTGAYAVRDALFAGELFLSSTTHLVDSGVDTGKILMRSRPLVIDPDRDNCSDQTVSYYQEELKRYGDWIILPKTLKYIAEGRYAQKNEELYIDNNPIPCGVYC